MVTTREPNAPATSLLEIALHWADGTPPVVARVDKVHARQLIARLAFAAPDELESTLAGVSSEPIRLLLGVQAFCRHLFDRGGCLALADVGGTMWIIPARSVRAIRLRLVAVPTGPRTTSDAVEMRSAFSSPSSESSKPC